MRPCNGIGQFARSPEFASRPATPVRKVGEGRPNVVDRIIDGEVHFLINTTASKRTISDSFSIRRETLMHRVPYFTTLTGARAALGAMERARDAGYGVRSLQEYHSHGR